MLAAIILEIAGYVKQKLATFQLHLSRLHITKPDIVLLPKMSPWTLDAQTKFWMFIQKLTKLYLKQFFVLSFIQSEGV